MNPAVKEQIIFVLDDDNEVNTSWYTQAANDASLEYGRQMVKLILQQLRTQIR